MWNAIYVREYYMQFYSLSKWLWRNILADVFAFRVIMTSDMRCIRLLFFSLAAGSFNLMDKIFTFIFLDNAQNDKRIVCVCV